MGLIMAFPNNRKRINRASRNVRNLVAETILHPHDFIAPLFIESGANIKSEIPSMPGYFRYSLDFVLDEIQELVDVGIQSVLLFAKEADDKKDNTGEHASDPNGLMQQSIRAIKAQFPQLVVMTDIALDPYSIYGHDGIVDIEKGEIINDATINALVKMALSHVKSGADWVAPSDMMDGRIGAIREAFNTNGFKDKGILAYSAKYASALYGPFRDALDSAPGFGDKKSYQMDPRNRKEGIDEANLDEAEGADMLMVKPGSYYLDVVGDLSKSSNLPIAVYQVSGEYAMIKAASEKGWLNENEIMKESLIAFKRAGAKVIITYFAKEICKHLINNYPNS